MKGYPTMITLRKLAPDHPDIPKVWKLFREAFHESERELLSSLLEFPEAALYGIYPDDLSGKFIGFFVSQAMMRSSVSAGGRFICGTDSMKVPSTTAIRVLQL